MCCQRLPLRLAREQEQVDEDAHLRAQDLGDHRRADVVDGAERVAAVASARRRWKSAVMKMIGVCADLRRLRISCAVSRPSSPGMLTSSRITAKSCCEHLLQRLLARGRGDDVLLQLLEHGTQRQQLVGTVVDDQDAGAVDVRASRHVAADTAIASRRWRHRDSHARSTPIMSSVSTGLDR